MGFYMRYIATDDQSVSLEEIGTAIQSVDPEYSIIDEEVHHGAELYGEIEINLRGTELCDEELGELAESVEDIQGENKQQVLDSLRDAKSIVAVRVLWQERNTEDTLEKLDPIWNWLFENRQGILQVDGDGYYDETGSIFDLE